MNATPAVSQAPVGAGSADSTQSGTGGQDFAAALSDAGPKPALRKPAASKVHNGGAAGGQLPVPGNLSPPATFPTPSTVAGAAAAAGAAASAAVGAQGVVGADTTSGGAPGAAPGTAPGAASGAAAGKAPGSTSDPVLEAAATPGPPGETADLNSNSAALDPPAAAPGATGAATFTAEFAQALGLPGAVGASGTDSSVTAAPGTSAGGPAATAPGARIENAGARRAIAEAVGALTLVSPAGAMAGSVAKPITGAAATAATAAATSGPSTADGGASTNTDATAQNPTLAALVAAVSGSVATSDPDYAGAADSPASATDDLATPATGAAAEDAGGLAGSAVPAFAGAVQAGAVQAGVAMAHAAAAAAAKTPINAQALAGSGTPDKHSQDGTGNSLLIDTSGNSIAGTAQISTTAGIGSGAISTPTLKLPAAVESPEFGQGLADRVSWMVDNNLNGAKLQVNPPQLGPIEVRIAVQGDHAQVWLTSHSAVTRDALEASSPKLREMLGSQGFGQVSVDISQRSFQERSPQAQPYDWTPAVNRGASTATASSAAVSMPRMPSGAVDAYA
jgi:flagellar hook-length control protein FliK